MSDAKVRYVVMYVLLVISFMQQSMQWSFQKKDTVCHVILFIC